MAKNGEEFLFGPEMHKKGKPDDTLLQFVAIGMRFADMVLGNKQQDMALNLTRLWAATQPGSQHPPDIWTVYEYFCGQLALYHQGSSQRAPAPGGAVYGSSPVAGGNPPASGGPS